MKMVIPNDLPFRTRHAGDRPSNLLVSLLSSGNFLGEEEFFENKKRAFTAVVKSPTVELYKLSLEVLRYLDIINISRNSI